MTESTWHASCLKHRCLVAMVAFTGMEPTYHRVNGSDGCTCALETLAIHHMNHSPLDALKDVEQQIDALKDAIKAHHVLGKCRCVEHGFCKECKCWFSLNTGPNGECEKCQGIRKTHDLRQIKRDTTGD